MFVGEVWWIAPVTIGAGAFGWLGLRGQRTAGARRLGLSAAKRDVRSARDAVARGRPDVALARADLVRTQAERTAHSASERDLATARRALANARQSARAASASLRAARTSLRAVRATMPRVGSDPAEFPLARVMAAHNAVLVRWMQYETDHAKLIAYPEMSDGRSPVMAAFLREQSIAQGLRPASAGVRMTPADFAAYRDAVRRVESAFDAAEDSVVRQVSGKATPPGFEFGNWADAAQDLLWSAQRAVTWSAEAMSRVSEGTAASGWRFAPRSASERPTQKADATARPPRAPQP